MKTAEEILNEYGMPNTLNNRLLVEYIQKDAIIHEWCELTNTYNNIISPQFGIHNNDCPLEVCIFDVNDPNYIAK